MTSVPGRLLASVAAMAAIGLVVPASADQLLSGAVASASGQRLDGVQISAMKGGLTITTSVYTDGNGEYFFPALPDRKYNVWAQTLGFETAKGPVDLTAKRQQDFKLTAITDPEQKIKQMPSEMLAAALPEDTEADANMKRIFHNQCTGCHTPGYPLQFSFDEAGWNKIINLMKVIAGTGEYLELREVRRRRRADGGPEQVPGGDHQRDGKRRLLSGETHACLQADPDSRRSREPVTARTARGLRGRAARHGAGEPVGYGARGRERLARAELAGGPGGSAGDDGVSAAPLRAAAPMTSARR